MSQEDKARFDALGGDAALESYFRRSKHRVQRPVMRPGSSASVVSQFNHNLCVEIKPNSRPPDEDSSPKAVNG